MTKKENKNLYNALYKLAGKMERLEKQGKKEEVDLIYSTIITITYNLDINFTKIQLDRLKGEYNSI